MIYRNGMLFTYYGGTKASPYAIIESSSLQLTTIAQKERTSQ